MTTSKALIGLKRFVKRQLHGKAPIILMYHRVADVPVDPWGLAVHPARFQEQIDVLTRVRRVVHIHELAEAERRRSSSDKPLAAVTFDDGYYDVYKNARQVLQRHDCRMTLFVTTGMIGADREFWWDSLCRILVETEVLPRYLSLQTTIGKTMQWTVPGFDERDGRENLLHEIWAELQPRPFDELMRCIDDLAQWAGCNLNMRASYRAMTKEEVRDISDELIAIGAHTVTHPTLPAHRYDYQYREIAESRRTCEEIVERPVSAFAYPFGDHDTTTVSAVRNAGMSWACTVNAGVVKSRTDPMRLPRINIGNWDGDEFQKTIG